MTERGKEGADIAERLHHWLRSGEYEISEDLVDDALNEILKLRSQLRKAIGIVCDNLPREIDA